MRVIKLDVTRTEMEVTTPVVMFPTVNGISQEAFSSHYEAALEMPPIINQKYIVKHIIRPNGTRDSFLIKEDEVQFWADFFCACGVPNPRIVKFTVSSTYDALVRFFTELFKRERETPKPKVFKNSADRDSWIAKFYTEAFLAEAKKAEGQAEKEEKPKNARKKKTPKIPDQPEY
jgi:hypothetical protein